MRGGRGFRGRSREGARRGKRRRKEKKREEEEKRGFRKFRQKNKTSGNLSQRFYLFFFFDFNNQIFRLTSFQK